jgi:hypothetical protein
MHLPSIDRYRNTAYLLIKQFVFYRRLWLETYASNLAPVNENIRKVYPVALNYSKKSWEDTLFPSALLVRVGNLRVITGGLFWSLS